MLECQAPAGANIDEDIHSRVFNLTRNFDCSSDQTIHPSHIFAMYYPPTHLNLYQISTVCFVQLWFSFSPLYRIPTKSFIYHVSMYYVLSYQYVYYPTTHLNLYQSEYCLKESSSAFLPYSVQLYVVIVNSFCMKKHGSTRPKFKSTNFMLQWLLHSMYMLRRTSLKSRIIVEIFPQSYNHKKPAAKQLVEISDF